MTPGEKALWSAAYVRYLQDQQREMVEFGGGWSGERRQKFIKDLWYRAAEHAAGAVQQLRRMVVSGELLEAVDVEVASMAYEMLDRVVVL